jgi:alpha-beta hydrolase superfamily lysophospholipase
MPATAEPIPAPDRPRAPSPALTLALESTDGTRLHASYFPASRPRAGLLLVQGLQSHARWFEASGTANTLAEWGISCLAYDRRGSGRSSGTSGHADSPKDFLEDLAAGARELRRELDARSPRMPMHVLANGFGARVVLPYLAAHPDVFRSVILTAPGTHVSRRASYGPAQTLAILLAPSHFPYRTPLRDEDLVSAGPWLDWIRKDARSLRRVTAGFLRSANRLSWGMRRAIPRLRLPLLLVLSRRDVVVDNQAVRARFYARYAGPKQVVEYESDHYVDFTDEQPELARRLAAFVLAGPSSSKSS